MEEAMQQEAVNEFKAQLWGDMIEPTDARYEEERKVYNAMINRKPRLIAKCADVADVTTAIRFGQQHDLRVSIRGGGHNAGGLEFATMAWSSISPSSSTFMSIPQHELCGWAAVAHGAKLITRRIHSGSPCRQESFRRPALEA
jgi:hypothetical protein